MGCYRVLSTSMPFVKADYKGLDRGMVKIYLERNVYVNIF